MKYIYCIFVLLLLQIAAAFVLLYSGIINVAASEPHSALTRWALETARDSSIRRHARDVPAPPTDLSSQVRTGFSIYRTTCVECHGAPGSKRSQLAKGLNPPAPNLAETGEEMTPQELFWIAKNGIKMTGMPAWGKTHSDKELWAVVAFLKRLSSLSPEEYHELDIQTSPLENKSKARRGVTANDRERAQETAARKPR